VLQSVVDHFLLQFLISFSQFIFCSTSHLVFSIYFLLRCNSLHRSATHCSALQHSITHCNTLQNSKCCKPKLLVSIFELTQTICCNTLQHSATRCKTLQLAATHYNSLQYSFDVFLCLQNSCPPQVPLHSRMSPDCALQHTAPHCNTLQHTAIHEETST